MSCLINHCIKDIKNQAHHKTQTHREIFVLYPKPYISSQVGGTGWGTMDTDINPFDQAMAMVVTAELLPCLNYNYRHNEPIHFPHKITFAKVNTMFYEFLPLYSA